jgi:putative transposase
VQHLSKKLGNAQYDPVTKQGSKNREKIKAKLSRLHGDIASLREDAHHKLTTELARTCSVVGIEDLHLKGMFKNRKLARAMAEAGLGQLLQFLDTKIQAVGGQAIFVDRYFPSTKRCSGCGKRMSLKYRTYICLRCGLHIDRDLNAAINLREEARRLLERLGITLSDLGTGLDGSKKWPVDNDKTNQGS